MLAQPAPSPAVTEVRQTLDAARKEIDTYKSGRRSPGAADHPAIKWDAALWAYRERYPGPTRPRRRPRKPSACSCAPSCGTARTRGSCRSSSTIGPGSAWRRRSTTKGSRAKTCSTPSTRSRETAAVDHEAVDQIGRAVGHRPRVASSRRQRGGDRRARSGEIRVTGHASRRRSGRSPLRNQIPERRPPGAGCRRQGAKRRHHRPGGAARQAVVLVFWGTT